MRKYQVRFEYISRVRDHNGRALTAKIKDGVRTVLARNADEATARVRHQVPGSFGHWVNDNATESAK